MGQIGPGEKQRLRVEVADIVTDEDFATAGGDQVQFVFLMKMPAHQRAGETMLAIDDRQAVMVVHQFIRRVSRSGESRHG